MKKFLLLFIAIFCVFGLMACGGKNEVDEIFEYKSAEDIKNARGTIEIKFRVPSGTIATALKDIIPAFEAEWEGKIKVNLDTITGGYDGLLEQNIFDLNQGKAPHMTIAYPDHMATYLSGQGITSLQPYMDKENFDIEDFIQAYLPENQLADDNDDYYGLPLNKSTEVLIYNATVFEAMGYDIPATWDEAEVLCEQIIDDAKNGLLDELEGVKYSETDKKPSYYVEKGLFFPLSYDSTDNAFITMCRQWGAKYTERDTMNKGYALFNNDEAKAGLAYFQDLANRKLFAVAENFDESYASNAFKNLQCLITIGSSAGIGYNLPTGNKFKLGVAPIPVHEEDKSFVISQGTNVCVLSQSTNLQRAACWQLVKYLTSKEITVKFATTTGGYLPVRNSAYESEAYKKFLDPYMVDADGNAVYKDANGEFAEYIDGKYYVADENGEPKEVAVEDLEKVLKDNYYFALSAETSIAYRESYQMFVDPAFVGSSTIRDAVGTAFSKIIVSKDDIAKTLKETVDNLGPKYMK